MGIKVKAKKAMSQGAMNVYPAGSGAGARATARDVFRA